MNNKFKKYLPSKKLLWVSLISISVLLVLVLVYSLFNKENIFSSKNKKIPDLESKTMEELVQLDSDEDGLFDWEEALWGTNKYKVSTYGGVNDKEYVIKKQEELKAEQNSTQEEYNETDKFAQELLSSYLALKSSGADEDMAQGYFNALGQKIVDPTIVDTYVEEDAVLGSGDERADKFDYYNKLSDLFEGYKEKGLGDELDIVTSGLISGREEQYEELIQISEAYMGFAKDVINTPVPPSLVEQHIKIVNNAQKTGVSVADMAKVVSDPVVGLSGISKYQEHSENFIKSVEELQDLIQ